MTATPKNKTLQARVSSQDPDIVMFEIYKSATNTSESALLRQIIREWATTIDKEDLKAKLETIRDNAQATLDRLYSLPDDAMAILRSA